MNILQEDVILIKISICQLQCCARRVLSELPDCWREATRRVQCPV